jgi:uncharacterized integral membrane protein (TIGR00698 family)
VTTWFKLHFPGIVLCIVVTAAAMVLERFEVTLFGQRYLEALVLAILVGVVVRSFWTPGPVWTKGIGFSAKTLLEIAVVLLGASISADVLWGLGPLLLAGIALIVMLALASSYLICRAMGLARRMAILVACGNSICGNSAIAAVAPIIGAKPDEIASSIAFTAVLGVIVVLVLPLFVPLLELSLTQYGVLAGLTVYAVPQVLAATLPIGALSNQIGTLVKLVRVLMLGPVVFGLALAAGHRRRQADNPGAERRLPPLKDLVPWFITGFLLLALLRSLGFFSPELVRLLRTIAAVLTTIAMAALGLGVDVRIVAKAGPRVATAVTMSLVVLGVISFALIRLAGVE